MTKKLKKNFESRKSLTVTPQEDAEYMDAYFDASQEGDRRLSINITDEEYTLAENYFGTTNDYNVAGYILKNGKMLDFSGKHEGNPDPTYRTVDHRDIWIAWGQKKTNGNNTAEMVNMISNGNIRLMPETGGINLAVIPTEKQFNVLRGYINNFRGEVYIDVDAIDGDTVDSWYYNKGTASSKIISDIKAYFEKGTIPQQQSNLNQFRYSVSVNQTPKVAKVNTITAKKQPLTKAEKVQAVKDRVGSAWLAGQIESTNVQAGIEHEAKLLGGNLDAEVQKARVVSASAINALTNEQRDYSGTKRVGDSLSAIFTPVFKKGDEYTAEFYT